MGKMPMPLHRATTQPAPPQPMPLRWRLTVLMNSIAYATYVIRVNKLPAG